MMYEDYIMTKIELENQKLELIESIRKSDNTDYDKIYKLAEITLEIQKINNTICSAIRSMQSNYKNCELINLMINLLKIYKEGTWMLDSIIKEDKDRKQYIFICLTKQEIKSKDFSLEFLNTQIQEGNFLDNLLIYDVIQYTEEFDFCKYLFRTYANIEKYITAGYEFSTRYPFLQENIKNQLDENIDYIHHKYLKKKENNKGCYYSDTK